MRSKRTLAVAAFAALAVLVSACSIDVERNDDGSLGITGEISAESLAAEFERDPQNDSVEVSIDEGVMFVDVEGVDENGDYIADLRVELRAVEGAPHVDITDAHYNGWEVPDKLREQFNKAISKEIKKAVKENPDATLVSLVADDDRIVTRWRVETDD